MSSDFTLPVIILVSGNTIIIEPVPKASDEGADLKEAQLSEKYKKMYEDSLTRIKELTILNKGLESENRLLTERNIRMAAVLDKLRSTLDSFTENKK